MANRDASFTAATTAIAEPSPGSTGQTNGRRFGRVDSDRGAGWVVLVTDPDVGHTTLAEGALSVLTAMGLALLVPFVILLIGLPLAVLLRVLVDAISLASTLATR